MHEQDERSPRTREEKEEENEGLKPRAHVGTCYGARVGSYGRVDGDAGFGELASTDSYFEDTWTTVFMSVVLFRWRCCRFHGNRDVVDLSTQCSS